ncbi:hypothetical protein BH11MYX1_BH11MYX1_49070 [soil metagenome]
MLAATKRSARKVVIGCLLSGVIASAYLVYASVLSQDTAQDMTRLLGSFALLGVVPAWIARRWICKDVAALPKLLRFGSVMPATLTSATNRGAQQRLGIAWNEAGKPADGHIDILEFLGYVGRDTVVLVRPKSRFVGIVLNDRLLVGRRNPPDDHLFG